MVGGQIDHALFRRRPLTAVTGGDQILGRPLLDLGKVVVPGTHLGSQGDVGQPRPVSRLHIGQAGTTDLNVGKCPI